MHCKIGSPPPAQITQLVQQIRNHRDETKMEKPAPLDGHCTNYGPNY
jgi:hypothetical protein